ncbi:hypothetical protein K438DRAFT_1762521 [Mycena galopus ATCC 62051]|nr:hypothetical protein K438DRAFT_1762521 [Mycena galopus ATCC 62051]
MDGSAINPPSSEFGDTSTTSANITGIPGYLKAIQQLFKSVPSGFTRSVQSVKPEDLVPYYNVEVVSITGTLLRTIRPSAPHASRLEALRMYLTRVRELNLLKFSACIDVMAAGLINVIALKLLRDQPGKSLKVETTALSPGSFVNIHNKTVPRTDEIVGSLVVILPIIMHEYIQEWWEWESLSCTYVFESHF